MSMDEINQITAMLFSAATRGERKYLITSLIMEVRFML